jgi:hypothetical protein
VRVQLAARPPSAVTARGATEALCRCGRRSYYVGDECHKRIWFGADAAESPFPWSETSAVPGFRGELLEVIVRWLFHFGFNSACRRSPSAARVAVRAPAITHRAPSSHSTAQLRPAELVAAVAQPL